MHRSLLCFGGQGYLEMGVSAGSKLVFRVAVPLFSVLIYYEMVMENMQEKKAIPRVVGCAGSAGCHAGTPRNTTGILLQ